tara:strand:- start:1135 stop:1299 length:165 start_codon:yes stop_codon:yes gene_type:complete
VFPTPVFVEGYETAIMRVRAPVIHRTRTNKDPSYDPGIVWETVWLETLLEALLY